MTNYIDELARLRSLTDDELDAELDAIFRYDCEHKTNRMTEILILGMAAMNTKTCLDTIQ